MCWIHVFGDKACISRPMRLGLADSSSHRQGNIYSIICGQVNVEFVVVLWLLLGCVSNSLKHTECYFRILKCSFVSTGNSSCRQYYCNSVCIMFQDSNIIRRYFEFWCDLCWQIDRFLINKYLIELVQFNLLLGLPRSFATNTAIRKYIYFYTDTNVPDQNVKLLTIDLRDIQWCVANPSSAGTWSMILWQVSQARSSFFAPWQMKSVQFPSTWNSWEDRHIKIRRGGSA